MALEVHTLVCKFTFEQQLNSKVSSNIFTCEQQTRLSSQTDKDHSAWSEKGAANVITNSLAFNCHQPWT